MKRMGTAMPFVLLVLLSVLSKWVTKHAILGNLWALSFIGCVLMVPLLARHKLWLGYAALFFPFFVLTALVVLDWGSLSVGFN